MKNFEILVLNDNLAKIKNVTGVPFLILLDKNRRRVKKEAESILKGNEATEEYKAYDKKRIELNEKYAVKNTDGSFKMLKIEGDDTKEKYDIPIDKKVEYQTSLDALKLENKDILDKRDKQLKEWTEFLNNENTSFIPLFISEDLIPKDMNEQLFIISSLIKYNEE
jgi:hypothetical protein